MQTPKPRQEPSPEAEQAADLVVVSSYAQGKTWEPTMGLRVRRNIPSGDIIDIEQAWQCLETGEIEWRALPAK